MVAFGAWPDNPYGIGFHGRSPWRWQKGRCLGPTRSRTTRISPAGLGKTLPGADALAGLPVSRRATHRKPVTEPSCACAHFVGSASAVGAHAGDLGDKEYGLIFGSRRQAWRIGGHWPVLVLVVVSSLAVCVRRRTTDAAAAAASARRRLCRGTGGSAHAVTAESGMSWRRLRPPRPRSTRTSAGILIIAPRLHRAGRRRKSADHRAHGRLAWRVSAQSMAASAITTRSDAVCWLSGRPTESSPTTASPWRHQRSSTHHAPTIFPGLDHRRGGGRTRSWRCRRPGAQ